ncbi:hypothetical protein AVEN_249720-1 [Araneus ventricosus]|uniref:Uncharacterized protein n=1 Tax=Araneus ventricosus TaxID=182803 RepID=A0A4Y2C5P8_ARAVE|nr:hypothetical protein AVEN_249720-1 [Araneus ventricosus]
MQVTKTSKTSGYTVLDVCPKIFYISINYNHNFTKKPPNQPMKYRELSICHPTKNCDSASQFIDRFFKNRFLLKKLKKVPTEQSTNKASSCIPDDHKLFYKNLIAWPTIVEGDEFLDDDQDVRRKARIFA